MDIAGVIPAYNEEDYIDDCLESLEQQSRKLNLVVVVDDGSTDNTKKIALNYTDHVITITGKVENRLKDVSLAKVYNYGFSYLSNFDKKFDYILVLDSDTVLPNRYIEDLTHFMVENNLALSSGVIKGEESFRNVRGSGRIIRRDLFELMDGNYPVNYGFDSYPAHIASLYNLKYEINRDLKFTVLRPTSQNYSKDTFVINGRGFRAYGYLIVFALKSFLVTSIQIKSLAPLIYGTWGYLTLSKSKYYKKEMRFAVRRKQWKLLLSKIKFWE